MKAEWQSELSMVPGLGLSLAALLLLTSAATLAQDTNAALTSATEASATAPPRASSGVDESAFRIVTERNIFDANRSGGTVRLSSRRQVRVESFKLVGTMAYEKGAFAFFEGSNSELTKALKCDGIIAGHKLVDILADGVKLEADGKVTELAMGSAMRREDEGMWKPGEPVSSSSSSYSRRDDDDSRTQGREDRDRRSDYRDRASSSSSSSSSTSSADQAEVLKRLMERREKD